jgi:pyruvate/2-oxoacid:ferredoxin oxidoreductase alpha subunit
LGLVVAVVLDSLALMVEAVALAAVEDSPVVAVVVVALLVAQV